jgi:hypothetical protein
MIQVRIAAVPLSVIVGFNPTIHAMTAQKHCDETHGVGEVGGQLRWQRHGMDGRVKPGHDGRGFGLRPPRNDNVVL